MFLWALKLKFGQNWNNSLNNPWSWNWLTKICIASKIHPEWSKKWFLQVFPFPTEKQCLVLTISSNTLFFYSPEGWTTFGDHKSNFELDITINTSKWRLNWLLRTKTYTKVTMHIYRGIQKQKQHPFMLSNLNLDPFVQCWLILKL